MCRLSGNLETSNSWNHEGLTRPVTGLLLYPKVQKKKEKRKKSAEFEYVVVVLCRDIDFEIEKLYFTCRT
jgi:hypothetical protein